MSTRWPFDSAVRDVIANLARGEYAAVERRSAGVRLSAQELATAVVQYGRHLIPAPTEEPLPLDVVAILGSEPAAWSVDTPLWTAEEGRSDLTLQLTVRVEPEGGYQIQVDDLHVL
jgi:hypothetical protein